MRDETRQHQASHRGSHERYNSTPGLFRAAHPPHSPDAAATDSSLSPKLKGHWEGQRCLCEEEATSSVEQWFQKQDTHFVEVRISRTSAAPVHEC